MPSGGRKRRGKANAPSGAGRNGRGRAKGKKGGKADAPTPARRPEPDGVILSQLEEIDAEIADKHVDLEGRPSEAKLVSGVFPPIGGPSGPPPPPPPAGTTQSLCGWGHFEWDGGNWVRPIDDISYSHQEMWECLAGNDQTFDYAGTDAPSGGLPRWEEIDADILSQLEEIDAEAIAADDLDIDFEDDGDDAAKPEATSPARPGTGAAAPPPPRPRRPHALHRLYLAGDVEGDCWQRRLVGPGRIAGGDAEGWPALEGAVFGEHDYVGPFPAGRPAAEELRRRKAAIRRATAVYTWIGPPGAPGACAEVGYAHAIGKDVWIAGPEPLPGLRLVYEMASARLFGHGDPAEGLRAAIERARPAAPAERISEVVLVLSVEEGVEEITTRAGAKLKKPVVHYTFSGEEGEYSWASYGARRLEFLRPGDSVGLDGAVKARVDGGLVLTRCQLTRSEGDEMAAFDREV